MSEVFYEIKEVKNPPTENQIVKEIIFHFLAKVSDTLILYETKQDLFKSGTSNSRIDEVVSNFQRILQDVDPSLTLVKGKIREIYISYSS